MIESMEKEPQVKVSVIYAGGTISSIKSDEGHRVAHGGINLIEELQKHDAHAGDGCATGEPDIVYKGLSENITADDWARISDAVKRALASNPQAILITHGTDSMEQTARMLDDAFREELAQKNVKVLITGANDDISHPNTDAWANLGQVFSAAKDKTAAPGVYIAFHGRLIPAEYAVKEVFDGKGMNYTDKRSPEYTKALTDAKAASDAQIKKLEDLEAADFKGDYRIGAIDYAVNRVRPDHAEFLKYLEGRNPRAVVLTLYHSGTANTITPGQSVPELIQQIRAQKKDILFFAASENGEPIDLHAYETSVKLREAGVVPLYNMAADVALSKLKLMSPDLTSEQIIKSMLKNYAGEIDESRIITDDVEKLIVQYAK